MIIEYFYLHKIIPLHFITRRVTVAAMAETVRRERTRTGICGESGVLRHMTSHNKLWWPMMCFVKKLSFEPINNNILVHLCIGPTEVTNKLCSEWGHNVDVITVFITVYYSIINKWIFFNSSYHISETRLDTNYIVYTQASWRTIISYVDC